MQRYKSEHFVKQAIAMKECCTVKKKKKKSQPNNGTLATSKFSLKKKSLFVCFAYFVSLIKKSYPEFLQNLLTLNYFRRNLLPWWQKNPARLRLARRINLAVSEKFWYVQRGRRGGGGDKWGEGVGGCWRRKSKIRVGQLYPGVNLT